MVFTQEQEARIKEYAIACFTEYDLKVQGYVMHMQGAVHQMAGGTERVEQKASEAIEDMRNQCEAFQGVVEEKQGELTR